MTTQTNSRPDTKPATSRGPAGVRQAAQILQGMVDKRPVSGRELTDATKTAVDALDSEIQWLHDEIARSKASIEHLEAIRKLLRDMVKRILRSKKGARKNATVNKACNHTSGQA